MRFEFQDATWFRAPLRFIILAVSVFALLSLSPALVDGNSPDHLRAIFGIAVLAAFVLGGVLFIVSINDGGVEVAPDAITVHFESFFHATIPVEDIISVAAIDPRPRWRYRWGLSTNWHDRISCSHGGQMVEIMLARPYTARLWPRTIEVTHFWLAVREPARFTAALERSIAQREASMFVELGLARAA